MIEEVLRFSTFELRPKQAALLDGGRRVPLGSRALAILTLLARRAGEVVSTKEITKHAWPNMSVEDSNIRVQIAGLRRALRDGTKRPRFIVNEPGRGYRFAATVASTLRQAPHSRLTSIRWRELPSASPLVGRDEAITDVVERLVRERMVTLVGPGGIGKTSVAISSIARLVDRGHTEIYFVDLSTLTDQERVAAAIAAALYLPLSGEPIPAILNWLEGRSAMIVLDNCEHVILAAASLSETILHACIGVSILATSREVLRCKGEAVYRLPSLRFPPAEIEIPVDDIVAFPAVELFAARVATSLNPFPVTFANAGSVARICRQLDGIPLALELAAACAGTLGLNVLASELGNRLDFLTHGQRTIARHETLRAMLDWSHDLLSERDHTVFASLSVFRVAFTLEGAVVVAEMDRIARADILLAIHQLASASLLHVETAHATTTYRFLDTTRAYAQEKLVASGRLGQVRRQHARYIRIRLAEADWWERNGNLVDDLQAALDWAFSLDGDAQTGIELTIASAPLWLGRSQLGEYWTRVSQSLDRLAATNLTGGREEMQLQLSLGHLFFHIHGPGPTQVLAFQRALEIAEGLSDVPSMTTALRALASERAIMGDPVTALSLCNRLVGLSEANGNRETTAIASHTLALTYFRMGNLGEARRIGEALVARGEPASPSFYSVYRYDQTTAERASLACVLWIQGYADRALEMVRSAVEDAVQARNPSSLCYILSSSACPLALWAGHDGLAAHYIDLLAKETEKNAFAYLQGWADHYRRIWTARSERVDVANASLIPGLASLIWRERQILVSIEASLVSGPDLVVNRTRQPSWCAAELLRAEGEHELRSNQMNSRSSAESLFAEAMVVAHDQGALAWELRAATSLASCKRKGKEPQAALGILAPVLGRFQEGFETKDLLAASDLLADLQSLA